MTTAPGPPAPSAGSPAPAAAPSAGAALGVPAQPAAPAGERLEPDWPVLVAEVLADPSLLTLVSQPIVDVAGAVVAGYELLSRFAGPRHLTPDLWFAAADRLGVGAELEAVVVARAL